MTRIFRIRKRIALITAVLLLLGTVCFAVPTAADGEDGEPSNINSSVTDSVLGGGPQINAQAAVVMEVNSGAVLYSKNASASVAPTSLTKLMTALLAFENLSMSDTLSFSYASVYNIGTNVTRIGIVENERISVLDGLGAMLVASADEVAYALGEKMGGGKIANFYPMMNERMKALGGINTNFDSATGTGGTKQTSCAYDIGLLACELMKFPTYRTMAGARYYSIPVTNLKDARTMAQTHQFIRKNKTYEYAIAGKSGGASSDGRYSLCTYAEKDGMTIVAIVLGCSGNDASYDDSVSILNYAFENYKVHSMKSIESAVNDDYSGLFDYCPMFGDGTRDLIYIDRNSSVVLPHGGDPSTLTKTITYEIPSEYVHGENVIGHVVYRYQGHRVGRAGIIFYNQEYPMSQSEFDAVWPFFLVPPSMLESQGGEGVNIDNSYLAANITPAPANPTSGPVDPDAPTSTPRPSATPRVVRTNPNETDGPFGSLPVKTRALLLGGAIFLGTFLPCLIIICVVLPRRHRRKNRTTKRL